MLGAAVDDLWALIETRGDNSYDGGFILTGQDFGCIHHRVVTLPPTVWALLPADQVMTNAFNPAVMVSQ